jgi:hypothetical protein
MKGVCRVCELLRNDERRKDGEYCKFCEAFICKKCETNWLDRGRAALIEAELKYFKK